MLVKTATPLIFLIATTPIGGFAIISFMSETQLNPVYVCWGLIYGLVSLAFISVLPFMKNPKKEEKTINDEVRSGVE